MSGSLWEPALMLGVAFSLLVLACTPFIEAHARRLWRAMRGPRLLDTLEMGLVWLPVLFVYAGYCFARGEWATRRRRWKVRREARHAARARGENYRSEV